MKHISEYLQEQYIMVYSNIVSQVFARNIKVFTHNCFFLIIIKKNKSPATFFS